MKRTITLFLAVLCAFALLSCGKAEAPADIAATTLPVYELTAQLCQGTPLQVNRVITENVSCLHDYTLQPGQMKTLETATLTVISGAGLEDFMEDTLPKSTVDASAGISLLCGHHDHHDDHDHAQDPHIWLDPENGRTMAKNIYTALCDRYPEQKDIFALNFEKLNNTFDQVISYGNTQLASLRCKELVTFHDGFAYMAEAYGLHILHSMEEESGSEASARELIEICTDVTNHDIPAIFTEKNGTDRAATIVGTETGAKVYTLDTAMSDGYFNALYHNIDTLKEALG